MSEENAVELDELLETPINMEEVARTRKDSMLPVGTYTTTPPLTVAVRKSEEGRVFLRAFGAVTLGDNSGKVGFSVSPERKNKVVDAEDSGKPDFPSRLYVQLVKAYEDASGEKPSSLGSLKSYLENYPVKLRLIQGSDDNMVVAISAVKE